MCFWRVQWSSSLLFFLRATRGCWVHAPLLSRHGCQLRTWPSLSCAGVCGVVARPVCGVVARLVCGVAIPLVIPLVTRLVCGVYLHDSCAMCETQVVGSGRAQVIKLGRVPHLNPENTGNSGHMTATLSYLNNQLSQYFASKTSSQAMSDFYSM